MNFLFWILVLIFVSGLITLILYLRYIRTLRFEDELFDIGLFVFTGVKKENQVVGCMCQQDKYNPVPLVKYIYGDRKKSIKQQRKVILYKALDVLYLVGECGSPIILSVDKELKKLVDKLDSEDLLDRGILKKLALFNIRIYGPVDLAGCYHTAKELKAVLDK